MSIRRGRALWWVAVGIGVLVLGYGCSPAPGKRTHVTTYFEVEVPEGWSAKPEQYTMDWGRCQLVRLRAPGTKFPSVVVSATEARERTAVGELEEAAESAVRDLTLRGSQRPTKVVVAGTERPATLVRVLKEDGSEVEMLVVHFVLGKVGFWIQASQPDGPHREDIMRVLGSLNLDLTVRRGLGSP